MTFNEYHAQFNWDEIQQRIISKTLADVDRALAKTTPLDMEDFMALISSAASPRLELMAQRARTITLRRFGRTMQMYLPLYLSNECSNCCTYCGFSHLNKDLVRRTLNDEEILSEIRVIKQWPYEHLLLLTGEDSRKCGFEYLRHAIRLCKPYFKHISIEVQQMEMEEYRTLAEEGVSAVMVYQETYHREKYKTYHPAGKKSIFSYRVDTPDRICQAGIRKCGIGCLMGLEDWRTDCFFTALHLHYLEKKYWKTRFSISFPRLRPHAGLQDQKNIQTDRELLQLMCAYRLFDHDVELSLSTREGANFRDHATQICITSLSAGSRTDPGGYSLSKEELPQFIINDGRTPEEVCAVVRKNGYEPVWKDWDPVLDAL
jgi:2-iminoacetate synthase